MHRATVRGPCTDRVGWSGREGIAASGELGARGKEHKGSARKKEKALEVMAKGGFHGKSPGNYKANIIGTLFLKELSCCWGEPGLEKGKGGRGLMGGREESPRRRNMFKHLLGRRSRVWLNT